MHYAETCQLPSLKPPPAVRAEDGSLASRHDADENDLLAVDHCADGSAGLHKVGDVARSEGCQRWRRDDIDVSWRTLSFMGYLWCIWVLGDGDTGM